MRTNTRRAITMHSLQLQPLHTIPVVAYLCFLSFSACTCSSPAVFASERSAISGYRHPQHKKGGWRSWRATDARNRTAELKRSDAEMRSCFVHQTSPTKAKVQCEWGAHWCSCLSVAKNPGFGLISRLLCCTRAIASSAVFCSVDAT